MVNGVGALVRGVSGTQGEAAVLGQPVSMPRPVAAQKPEYPEHVELDVGMGEMLVRSRVHHRLSGYCVTGLVAACVEIPLRGEGVSE